MIGFFRRIRKKLADDNKPLKYARYAIGEIVLVVVGILIALQVNTWNEHRKNKGVETKYLKNLIIDLAYDTTYFEDQIILMKNAIKNQHVYISMSYEKQGTLDDVIKLFSFFDVNTQHLVIQNPTYADVISTGNLNIFSNENVKKSLMLYYKLYEEISENIKEYNLVSTEYMIEADRIAPNATKFYAPKLFNSEMYFEGEWEYINNPLSKEFLTLQLQISLYLERNQEHIEYYKTLKESARTLIQILQEELSEKSN